MAEISVYADWSATGEPRRVGQLSTQSAGGGRELFDFEFDTSALDDSDLSSEPFDPRIGA